MWIGLIRRLFIVFVLGAFLCAGLGQPVPTADAAPMSAPAGMSTKMDMGGGGTPMPCKSNIPNCFSSIGCVFMMALPPTYTPTATQVMWSRVFYTSVTSAQAGMSLEPDIGPPIRV